MLDPDAAFAQPLRLSHLAEASDPNEDLENAYREMTEATLRWVDARMRAEALRLQARPIRVSGSPVLTDNDFWTNRHRVMSGEQAIIARSSGHIDRLTAAATGEITDAADGLRRERN